MVVGCPRIDFLLAFAALDHASLYVVFQQFSGTRGSLDFPSTSLFAFHSLLCRFLFLNMFLKCWCLSGFSPRLLVILLYVSSQRLSLLPLRLRLALWVCNAFQYCKPRWLSWALDQTIQLLSIHLHLHVCSDVLFGTELILPFPCPQSVVPLSKQCFRPAAWESFFVPSFLYSSWCQLNLLPNIFTKIRLSLPFLIVTILAKPISLISLLESASLLEFAFQQYVLYTAAGVTN